jgi:hypothetical protein
MVRRVSRGVGTSRRRRRRKAGWGKSVFLSSASWGGEQVYSRGVVGRVSKQKQNPSQRPIRWLRMLVCFILNLFLLLLPLRTNRPLCFFIIVRARGTAGDRQWVRDIWKRYSARASLSIGTFSHFIETLVHLRICFSTIRLWCPSEPLLMSWKRVCSRRSWLQPLCQMMWHCVWWCDIMYDDVTLCMMIWHYVWWSEIMSDDVTLYVMMRHYVWWFDTMHE